MNFPYIATPLCTVCGQNFTVKSRNPIDVSRFTICPDCDDEWDGGKPELFLVKNDQKGEQP